MAFLSLNGCKVLSNFHETRHCGYCSGPTPWLNEMEMKKKISSVWQLSLEGFVELLDLILYFICLFFIGACCTRMMANPYHYLEGPLLSSSAITEPSVQIQVDPDRSS